MINDRKRDRSWTCTFPWTLQMCLFPLRWPLWRLRVYTRLRRV